MRLMTILITLALIGCASAPTTARPEFEQGISEPACGEPPSREELSLRFTSRYSPDKRDCIQAWAKYFEATATPESPEKIQRRSKMLAERAKREERERLEVDRYYRETIQSCRETLLDDQMFCLDPPFAEMGIVLHHLESGDVWYPPYYLDEGVQGNTSEIAIQCRKATMNGKLINGIRALDCVRTRVQLLNHQHRRKARIRGESE